MRKPCHTRAASSRRPRGVQEKFRTPWCAQWGLLQRRGCSVASSLLGLHATARTLNMLKVSAMARRCEMRALGTPQSRRSSAVRSHTAPLLAAAFARRPHGVHVGATASLPRRRGVSSAIALHALSVLVSIAFSRRLYGVATATIALPRRSYCVHRRLQGDDTAIPLRCEQSQQNCIKAYLSLPSSLCVQLHRGC